MKLWAYFLRNMGEKELNYNREVSEKEKNHNLVTLLKVLLHLEISLRF